ncbi:MAG: MATE family efflux transporter [Rhodoferax sp.]|jgi:putative MATE family efflux protein|nr:MATE family efflux transporter [Rhodoferax sp.]
MAVAWPLLAELVLGFGVGFVGMWLVSKESDTAAAAFGLANHVQGAFFLLFRIISMGVGVVITQNLGAGNRRDADQTALASLGASTWLGLGSALLLLLVTDPLLGIMQATTAVRSIAAPYLQVLALALFLDAFNASMAAVMRSHMHTRETMFNILCMHALHIALCFPLMQGAGPIAPMGMIGFAVALTVSRAFGLGMHLWLWRSVLRLAPTGRDALVIRWSNLRSSVAIGLPGAAEAIAYRVAILVSVTVVSGMGTVELATQGYAMQIMNVIVLSTVALGFAGEILVGHLIGAGELRQAMMLVRKCLFWGLAVSTSVAVLTALTAPWTLRLFTSDATIIAQATTLLWVTVLLEPGRTCNIVIITALRAAGDARFPVVAGSASMILIMGFGSWLLGVHFGWGLTGVWFAYALDEGVRGGIMAARWFGLGWVKHAVASRRLVNRSAA